MATRAQLLTWLRRRLQETSAAQWSDATLQEYINDGYREVAEAIKMVDPEWLVYTDSHNIVANQELYKLPTNCDSIIAVWYKGSASAEYKQLDYRRRLTQDKLDVSASEVNYSIKGRYIKLSPKPTTAVTAGIKLDYVPVVSLGDDTDVPEFPASLHKGIVFAAQLLALGDTAEVSDKQQVQTELDRMLVRAQQTYDTNRDQDEFITPDDDLKMYPSGWE